MPGTIRKIIDRIKDVRSGGNSVVALTVETRLVLQGFDPQRFGYDVADDPARLARIRAIAEEMGIDVDDLIAAADVAPDPNAEPGPMPGPPVRSAAAAAGKVGSSAAQPSQSAGGQAAGASGLGGLQSGEPAASASTGRAQSAPASGLGGLQSGEPAPSAAAGSPAVPAGGGRSSGASGLSGLQSAEPAHPAAAPAPPAPAPAPAQPAEPEIEDDHPLHSFHEVAEGVLNELEVSGDYGSRSGASFEQLMRASLLMGLYSVSNDRSLCDHIRHNNLYRWFLGLRGSAGRFDAAAFGEDRQEALASVSGRAFFDRLVARAAKRGLFRSEGLDVNGRLIKSWTSKGQAGG